MLVYVFVPCANGENVPLNAPQLFGENSPLNARQIFPAVPREKFEGASEGGIPPWDGGGRCSGWAFAKDVRAHSMCFFCVFLLSESCMCMCELCCVWVWVSQEADVSHTSCVSSACVCLTPHVSQQADRGDRRDGSDSTTQSSSTRLAAASPSLAVRSAAYTQDGRVCS